MREWERRVFAEQGLSERVVLESAGRALAAAVERHHPRGRIVGVIGRGNNGGDTLVALRTLQARGREVLAAPIDGAAPSDELGHGWPVPMQPDLAVACAWGDVVLDGILGTGARGAPRDAAAAAIRCINAAGRAVVAVDGPSGVDLEDGRVAGEAVRAEATITFGALKRGLLLFPGRAHAGRILLAEVGFPPLEADQVREALITDRWVAGHLPPIAPDAHKSAVGLVAVVAGRQGFGGAPILTAMGALRAGCGGVRVFSVDANRLSTHAAVPEAVFVDRDGPNVHEMLAGTRAAAVGPGLGTDPGARRLLEEILARYEGALVLDADALTLLAVGTELPDHVRGRTILTPHPGELARLAGVSVREVLADRLGAAESVARRYGCVLLAKGSPSLVVAPGRTTLYSIAGHSGVATGGMGDTLAGVVAALLAGGAGPREAAGVGLHLAGRAAEAAGRGRGLLPRDVAEALPSVFESVSSAIIEPEPPFLLEIPAAS
jgi:ADP-dependent NAD(P)H-hydrate dehydratase / NAD(P)H-hydrate epimerase